MTALPATSSSDLGSASAAAVKAAFVYNFGKFVEWPPESLQGSTSFNICTIGDVDDFHAALTELVNRKLQGLPVHIRETAKTTDFAGCHTLLIAPSEHERLRDILKAAQPLHILTVSDMDDFAENGGIIGLVTRNGRVQFNINVRAAKSAGLSISSELMGLAHQVIGQENG